MLPPLRSSQLKGSAEPHTAIGDAEQPDSTCYQHLGHVGTDVGDEFRGRCSRLQTRKMYSVRAVLDGPPPVVPLLLLQNIVHLLLRTYDEQEWAVRKPGSKV